MKFCENCKFYVEFISLLVPPGVGYNPHIERCKHPDNIIVESNYKTKKEICVKSPKDINHDNNCPWYKTKSFWDKICS